jgi:lysophospholipase L1-like esterase
MKHSFLLFLLILVSSPFLMAQNKSLSYLALGDSYTIGESVSADERWPYQLVARLAEDGIDVDTPEIIAATGWTTDELNAAIDASGNKKKYDMVSLLIGVNNQYRGYHIEIFKNEFAELLFKAAKFAGNDFKKVFIVSIPDYGVTPFGESGDPEKIAREIDQYNSIAKSIAKENGVRFYDINPLSKTARGEKKLTAEDGLHPSGEMYSKWVEVMYEGVKSGLSR